MALQLGFINNLGFNEIALIVVLALMLFGPRRLPEMGRMMGRTMGQWRRGYYDLKRSFELEVEEAERVERRKELREQQQAPAAPASSTEAPAESSPPAAENSPRPLGVPRGADSAVGDSASADEPKAEDD